MDRGGILTVSLNLVCKIEQLAWPAAKDEASAIRHKVFIEEQGVSTEEEWDEYDHQAWHLLAYATASADEQALEIIDAAKQLPSRSALGCARLIPCNNSNQSSLEKAIKVTRMAVVKEARGLGVGSQLLMRAERIAREQDYSLLYLDAQVSAVEFYKAHGFNSEGEIFMDAGIEHLRMTKSLKSDVIRFNSLDQAMALISKHCKQANKQVDIFSQNLNKLIYANEELVSQLSSLARSGRDSRVRILVQDTRALAKSRHPLVTLCQRLPSHMEIKRYLEGAKQEDIAYICCDRSHLVYFADEENIEGFARLDARPESQKILEEFDYLWQKQSCYDPNLKRFSL